MLEYNEGSITGMGYLSLVNTEVNWLLRAFALSRSFVIGLSFTLRVGMPMFQFSESPVSPVSDERVERDIHRSLRYAEHTVEWRCRRRSHLLEGEKLGPASDRPARSAQRVPHVRDRVAAVPHKWIVGPR